MVKFRYKDGLVIHCNEKVADIMKRLGRGDIVRDAPAPAPAPASAEKPAKGKKAAQKAAEEFL